MKFRCVMLSCVALIGMQPLVANFDPVDALNLLIEISRHHSENLLALSQEERAERKAALLKEAEEIRAQMYSPRQERLLKCATYGSVAACFIAQIAVAIALRASNEYDIAERYLKQAHESGNYEFLKKRCLETLEGYDQLLSDWNANKWLAYKVMAASCGAGLVGVCGLIPFNQKLEKQKELKEKLEKITQQIAELGALETV